METKQIVLVLLKTKYTVLKGKCLFNKHLHSLTYNEYVDKYLRRQDGKQNTHTISLKVLETICLAIKYHLIKKNSRILALTLTIFQYLNT